MRGGVCCYPWRSSPSALVSRKVQSSQIELGTPYSRLVAAPRPRCGLWWLTKAQRAARRNQHDDNGSTWGHSSARIYRPHTSPIIIANEKHQFRTKKVDAGTIKPLSLFFNDYGFSKCLPHLSPIGPAQFRRLPAPSLTANSDRLPCPGGLTSRISPRSATSTTCQEETRLTPDLADENVRRPRGDHLREDAGPR